MLRSMTGFGGAEAEVNGVRYSVEVRSVNNRYLKIVIKLPDGLWSVEADIEKLLRSQLSRGTVTLTVRMKLPDEAAAYNVNTAALTRYIEQLRPLEIEANPILRIDLASLMQLPAVCEPPAVEDLCRETQAGLMDLITRAVGVLIAMREREGETVTADLTGNCAEIRKRLASVAERSPVVVQEYHQKLSERVEALTREAKLKIDEESLGEVAIFADRSDIAEEVSRLMAHLEQFAQTVTTGDRMGRKLDFIAQEMLREANTIASKASDAEIGRDVVEIKTAIDRIKEQVQNVE